LAVIQFIFMEKIFLSCIIVLMVLSIGCTSYFSNLTASHHNLKLDEQAVFEKEGNRFSTEIKNIAGTSSSTRVTEIIVTIRIKNTGDRAVSLMGYPRLTDADGNQYPGKSIYISTVHPGGEFTGTSSIFVPSDEAYDSLKKSAALTLRFQDTKLIPYEATWDIDISTL
jgi:hypothetical protein